MKIKFGQHVRLGEARFNSEDLGRDYYNRTWRGRFLGEAVHGIFGVYKISGVKQYDKAVIFKVIKGVQYKIPALTCFPGGMPNGGAGRVKLEAARVIYKTFSVEQKAAYDLKARAELLTDGFNIYLKEYNELNP